VLIKCYLIQWRIHCTSSLLLQYMLEYTVNHEKNVLTLTEVYGGFFSESVEKIFKKKQHNQ
jgi:hypothetical protein